MFDGGALALLGGGLAFKSYNSRCFSIFLIISRSSIKDKIFTPPAFGAGKWYGKVQEAFK
jgi:hypothetical protein